MNGSDKFQVNASGAYVNGDLTVNGTVDILDSIIHTGDTNTKIRFPPVIPLQQKLLELKDFASTQVEM